MTKMKTLTVSGQTYTVWDPEAVSFEQPQQLTPCQQAQARSNLDVWSVSELVRRFCPAFTDGGALVTCEPMEGYPLEVVSRILPTQSGSGEPSPDNIRPLSGHTAVKLTHENGADAMEFTADLGQSVYGGSLDWATGVLTIDRAIRTYTGTEIDFNYNTKGYINGGNTLASIISSVEKTTGVYADVVCSHMRTDDRYESNKEGVWCRAGKSGVVFNMDAKEDLSNVTQQYVVDLFKRWFAEQYANGTPVQVVYKMGTPITVQLTPQQILALSGKNALYSDTGDTQVTGRADPTVIIQKLTNAILSLGGDL